MLSEKQITRQCAAQALTECHDSVFLSLHIKFKLQNPAFPPAHPLFTLVWDHILLLHWWYANGFSALFLLVFGFYWTWRRSGMSHGDHSLMDEVEHSISEKKDHSQELHPQPELPCYLILSAFVHVFRLVVLLTPTSPAFSWVTVWADRLRHCNSQLYLVTITGFPEDTTFLGLSVFI